ncbi:hypothetical protein DPMN_092704 [Dreissena polymorpha]|uniref:Uncharacterized protein n=1 Tax=Dreissena polymorpha TaxID=45954 RepID=A0A9D4L2A7_DREPO|nr:hypothetical protein DPMN_092704 [Dreissena polymorpha]
MSDMPIKCCTPTKEEISSAIKKLKKRQIYIPDSRPAETLEADVETSVELLHPLFSNIW